MVRMHNGTFFFTLRFNNTDAVGQFIRQDIFVRRNSAGDCIKQIIDLLRQLRSAAPDLQQIIDQSLKQIDRGVVAYAGAAV